MTNKWVVDADHPQGYSVPMAPDEQAQFDADQAAAAVNFAATQIVAANETSLRGKVDQGMATLETAATNWDTLTASQKDTATKIAVRLLARLSRLVLRHLEVAP